MGVGRVRLQITNNITRLQILAKKVFHSKKNPCIYWIIFIYYIVTFKSRPNIGLFFGKLIGQSPKQKGFIMEKRTFSKVDGYEIAAVGATRCFVLETPDEMRSMAQVIRLTIFHFGYDEELKAKVSESGIPIWLNTPEKYTTVLDEYKKFLGMDSLPTKEDFEKIREEMIKLTLAGIHLRRELPDDEELSTEVEKFLDQVITALDPHLSEIMISNKYMDTMTKDQWLEKRNDLIKSLKGQKDE